MLCRVKDSNARRIPASTVQSSTCGIQRSVGVLLTYYPVHDRHAALTENTVVDTAQHPIYQRVASHGIKRLQGRLVF